MNHPSDDALNAAWNDLATGHDPGASLGIDPTDAAMLRSMRNTAASIEPDPAFREQLWADLSRRPAIPATSPMVTPSLLASAAHRTGATTMTPRLATTSRRWSPPIATIAAALVIALVGYGALSLSGANPSGLNLDLNQVPNASAQGQGQELSDNPVVGTWVVWANAYTGSNTVIQTVTFEPDGTLLTQFVLAQVGTTPGTWKVEEDGRITYTFTAVIRGETLSNFTGEEPFIPQLFQISGSFGLAADQKTWEDERTSSIFLTVDPSGNSYRLTEPDDVANPQPWLNVDIRSPERIEDLIARSPEMTAEQEALLNASGSQPSDSANATIQANEAAVPTPTQSQVTVTPIATTALPTPTAAIEQQATISTQATMTAETATTQPIPTEQATVTPIATLAP